MQTAYEDLGGLFLIISFYINKSSKYLISPFDVDDILDIYEQKVLEKMNKI